MCPYAVYAHYEAAKTAKSAFLHLQCIVVYGHDRDELGRELKPDCAELCSSLGQRIVILDLHGRTKVYGPKENDGLTEPAYRS